MRCGKGIQVYRGWLVSKSQPARMRCGKGIIYAFLSLHVLSQPARMRCGKDRPCGAHAVPNSRNPHECAVAKMEASGTSVEQQVATRTNALWQRCQSRQHQADGGVATRTNALWQIESCTVWRCVAVSQPARMRCGKVDRDIRF